MDITDVMGLKDVGCKAIDKISAAINTLYKPVDIVLTAKAESKALLIKAKAEAQCELTNAKTAEDIKDYTVLREELRNKNLVETLTRSIDIVGDKNVSPEPLNRDWFIRWMDCTGCFTDQDVQELWAQVLAREVSHPNSVSLRTMETLKNMSKTEGEAFQYICQFILISDEDHFIYSSESDLKWNDFLMAEEAGLLKIIRGLCHTVTVQEDINEESDHYVIRYQNKRIGCRFKIPNSSINIPIIQVTRCGRELLPIVNCEKLVNQPYLNNFLDFLKSNNVEYNISDI